jgi:uncharacterized membrane-anchored protein YitT (DUF2179 family)
MSSVPAENNSTTWSMIFALLTPVFGAIGFSLIYLLLGGGLGGAILIFIFAKLLGR